MHFANVFEHCLTGSPQPMNLLEIRAKRKKNRNDLTGFYFFAWSANTFLESGF